MTSFCGTFPKTMWKKFSQKGRPASGAIGARPLDSRFDAATAVGGAATVRAVPHGDGEGDVDGDVDWFSDEPIQVTLTGPVIFQSGEADLYTFKIAAQSAD